MLDGELVGSEDDVAIDVGDRHLGSGYHIEPVEGNGIHLTLLVGQLAGAETGSFVDHKRRHDFDIAGLGGLVEEEVDEGALQTGSFAFVDGETGASNLVAQFKVDDVVFGTQLPMGQSTLWQVGLGAKLGNDNIVSLILALGNGDVRSVGEGDKLGIEISVDGGLLLGELFFLRLEVGGACLKGFGFVALALFEQDAYLLGDAVLLSFDGIGFLL